MSLVDFSKTIKDLKGNELENAGEKITLKDVCVNALIAALPDDKADGTTKHKYWKLAHQISSSKDPLDITAEEKSILKSRIDKIYGALVVGYAFEILEDRV